MSITYEEALATLQSMFAEPWTQDTLDSILRNQKGHMENTIDLILRHGTGDPEALVEQLEAGIDPRQSATAADEELARQLSHQQQQHNSTTGNDSAPTSRTGIDNNSSNQTQRVGKGDPTTLDADFLRVPGFAPIGRNSLSDDEALARMLQDELFTQELSRNPDFAHLATGRSGRSAQPQTTPSTAGLVNPAMAAAKSFGDFARGLTANVGGGNANAAAAASRSASSGNGAPNSPQPNIMEKISELGDTAKRRLQILAAQFNAANLNNSYNANRANTTSSGGGGGGEFRGLLDDDDNMELAARKDL